MATQTKPENNIDTHTPMVDMHQYLNMMMSNMIFKQMSSVFDTDNVKLSGANILKLFAIMSMDEIRKILMSAIKSIFKYFGDNYIGVLQWINNNIFQNFFVKLLIKIFNKFISLFKGKQQQVLYTLPDIEPTNYIIIQMKPNIEFLDSLIKYVKLNDNCSYLVSNNKHLELPDLKNITVKETWTNITVNYQDTEISINQPLEFVFATSKNSIKLKENIFKSGFNPSLTYNRLSDIIDDVEVKNIISNYGIVFFNL